MFDAGIDDVGSHPARVIVVDVVVVVVVVLAARPMMKCRLIIHGAKPFAWFEFCLFSFFFVVVFDF